jgi:hypothetical protein
MAARPYHHGLECSEFFELRSSSFIVLRPQDKIPVIRHQAITHNTHIAFLERLNDHAFNSEEVIVAQEQLLKPYFTIQCVVNQATGSIRAVRGIPAI